MRTEPKKYLKIVLTFDLNNAILRVAWTAPYIVLEKGMPKTDVVFFKTRDGTVPTLEWLDKQSPKVQDKFVERLNRLMTHGYELRRPLADYLRDKIHELRVRCMGQHYRLLYFFCGGTAVLSHGTAKEKRVPEKEINLAIARRAEYERDPGKHTYQDS